MILKEIDADLPDVHCEANQIKQVFLNVIKNAFDAMPRGGTLIVRIRREPNHLVFECIDEGNGIDHKIETKLGEPFYTTKEKGTGLGLMVTYKIIETHRGDITIRNREDRTGAIVRIVLPL
jgi:signal transduction histidine kinase